MAKALKIAAIVVGVAALVVTGVGLAMGAAAFATTFGISATTLATALSVTATVLSFAATILAKPPKLTSAGTQLDFIADPSSGLPYVVGDTRVGMNLVHEASWGDRNRFLGLVGVISCAGPIFNYDGLYGDNSLLSVDFTGNVTGYYTGFMWHRHQTGLRPEAAALSMVENGGSTSMPDWGSSSKLSSLAASGIIMKSDVDNGKIFAAGTPLFTHQVRGVLAYDARFDSTQPGGGGFQRPLDEDTYEYTYNPWAHAQTWAIGRWVNDKKVIGASVPVDNMDWPAFQEAAAISDANGWTVHGRVMSSDRKWDVLKTFAQHGGGYPMPSGAKLSCLVNAPKVSLETIEESDIRGGVSAPQVATRRARFNGAIPRYRSPDHAWEIVPGDAIRNSTYLSEDGGKEHTKEVEFPLCKDPDQAAQLAAYDIANTRERFPITVELGWYWSQYKLGDCLTLNLPSARLYNQKCVVIGRTLNPSSNTITLQFRTETDSKHTWALGVAGTPPPTTTVGYTPGAGDAGAGYTVLETQSILRQTYPKGLTLTGADNGTSAKITLSAFTFDYPIPIGDVAIAGTHAVTGLSFSTVYYLYADVAAIGDPSPTYGATTVYGTALNSSAHPMRIFLGQQSTPADGGTDTSGGGGGGGYGGGIVLPGGGHDYP